MPRSALLAVCCSLALLACGSVGAPRPPLLDIPGRVEDFAAWQEGAELRAAWTWPVLGSEGEVFHGLERFEILAVDVPEQAPLPPPDVWEQFGEVVAAAEEALAQNSPGDRITISAPLAERIGKRTLFAVRAVSDRSKASAWSEPIAFSIVQPPARAGSPAPEATPEGIRLRWPAATDASGYLLERRIGDGEFIVLAQTPDPEYLDRGPVWGKSHQYRVRGQRASDAPRPVLGEYSEVAALTPEDRFAPASPRDVRGVATPSGVELSWTSNEEPDLAGFFILRDGVRLNAEAAEAAAFSDLSGAGGAAYRYSVIAVDRLGNESDPSEPVEVRRP